MLCEHPTPCCHKGALDEVAEGSKPREWNSERSRARRAAGALPVRGVAAASLLEGKVGQTLVTLIPRAGQAVGSGRPLWDTQLLSTGVGGKSQVCRGPLYFRN